MRLEFILMSEEFRKLIEPDGADIKPANRVMVKGVSVPEYLAEWLKAHGDELIPQNMISRYRGVGPATIAKLKDAGFNITSTNYGKAEQKLALLRAKEQRLLQMQADVKIWLRACREQIAKHS